MVILFYGSVCTTAHGSRRLPWVFWKTLYVICTIYVVFHNGHHFCFFLSNDRELILRVALGLISILWWVRYHQKCKRDVEVRDRDETETFGFQSETRPRSRPSHFSRDRDRDWDVRFWVRDETEIETLIGRDRDIFRDLGVLSYIW